MYLHYVPSLVRALLPGFMWRHPTEEKIIYLTFDDGPVPEATPFVLDTLAEYQAQATFFCVGNNVTKHPALYERLLREGHTVGNHTYHHRNGWKTDNAAYLADVAACQTALNQEARLFRPPYGRLRSSQAARLRPHYELVLWDVLTGDFDHWVKPESCLRQSIRHSRSGSIVLFHDSVKAWDRLHYALPRYLCHFKERGYRFAAL